jgi:uncharacterized protein (DUF433 family)
VSIAAEYVDIGTLIDQRDGYRGGRPFVVGTGITVDRISVLLNVEKMSPAEMADAANLSLPQVHAALAFYHANKAVIDAELDAEAAEYAAGARKSSSQS